MDDPRDWSTSEGEVEIMWDTDEYEDFGIFRGEGSTYVIDYDLVDTHDQLVNEVCRLIGKEYPDLDFEPDDFTIVNEDEFWEQRGGNPGKWDDDDLYLESGDGLTAEVEFIEDDANTGFKKGDTLSVPLDIEETATECITKEEFKWYMQDVVKQYVLDNGLKDKKQAAWIHPN